jgi:hypothetical protein
VPPNRMKLIRKTKKNCLSDSEFFSSRIDFMA